MRNRLTSFLWSFINSIYYQGSNVLCQLCGWGGIEFLNNRCPKCNSLPRQRLIPFCIGLIDIKPNKVLHIGPNKSEYYFVKNQLNPDIYDRVDIDNNSYSNIKHDITKKGLKNNYYDLVLIWHVFEHIKDDLKAINQLSKTLSNHGRLVVSVPIYPKNNLKTFEVKNIKREENYELYGHEDHYRSCGLDYWKRFIKNGLKLDITIDDKVISKNKLVNYGLSKDHIAWVFKK